MQTIIAAFPDDIIADQAIMFLNEQGVRDAQRLSYEPNDTDTLGRFTRLDVPAERAQLYADAMRSGAAVVIAHTDKDARRLATELDRMGSMDLDAASNQWLPDENVRAPDQDLEVIEEDVQVGKRQVERGGVRVRTFVTEHPVEENIELTNERIDVQRERVDEPVNPATLEAALTEEEFVVTAKGEEVVIGKEARVVERVHVGKESETRTENVQETERRRDVEVEAITDAPRPSRR